MARRRSKRTSSKHSRGGLIAVLVLVGLSMLTALPPAVGAGLVALLIAGFVLYLVVRPKRGAPLRADPASPDFYRDDTQARRNVASTPPSSPVEAAVNASDASPGFRLPPAPAGYGAATWIAAGQAVEVASTTLPLGLLYIGTALSAANGQVDPCLIDPSLAVGNYGDYSQRQFGYWPSYRDIPPTARRAYLNWLAGGRRQPDADIGYVFIFFYGLERRAIIDAQRSDEAKADWPLIAGELQALLAVYGKNHSFRRYANDLLAWVQLASMPDKLYLAPVPILPINDDLPLYLKVALGQAAHAGAPVPAALALAWLRHAPEACFRTPAKRCGREFEALFAQHYAGHFGDGMVLPKNRTRLKFVYRPASAGFRGVSDIRLSFNDLPDVTVLTAWFSKLKPIVEAATVELEPYSRYIGKNPTAAHALEGLLQLPSTLWPASAQAALAGLKVRMGSGMVTLTFQSLLDTLQARTTLTREKVQGLARALESANIAMEPDVLSGAKAPKPDEKLVLFAVPPGEPLARATPAYHAALLTLELASTVAAADGAFGVAELNHLRQQIQSWRHLTPNHQRRLMAHLRLLTLKPASLPALRRKLDSLDVTARMTIAAFMTSVANADGVIDATEVKMLERVYQALGVETIAVMDTVQAVATAPDIQPTRQAAVMDPAAAALAARFDPVRLAQRQSEEVRFFASLRQATDATDATAPEAESSAAGAVPVRPVKPAAPAAGGFKLDAQRIAELQRDSEQVSALLATIFVDEESLAAVEQPVPDEDDDQAPSGLLGLDPSHSTFMRLLLSRPQWTRQELLDVSEDLELMLDGALEQVNDASYDRLALPLTEGDDPVIVNQEALDKMEA